MFGLKSLLYAIILVNKHRYANTNPGPDSPIFKDSGLAKVEFIRRDVVGLGHLALTSLNRRIKRTLFKTSISSVLFLSPYSHTAVN